MSEGNEIAKEGNVSTTDTAKEGNVSTTEPIQPPAAPKPEDVAMSLQFHGSTIHVIDGPKGRVFELDGTPYTMPGDAIAAARLKKVNAEKASSEKASSESQTTPAPEVNNGNDQTGNA